jgi:hypothetical protein
VSGKWVALDRQTSPSFRKTFLVVSKCLSDNYQKNMFFSVITLAALFGASNAIGHRSEIATPENHTREEFVGKLM